VKWTTRDHLHLDRTASAWLIRRFVDPQASFAYIGWDVAPDSSDPRAFGMPGIALGNHDAAGTCFRKVMAAHGLAGDEALVRLERAIAAGVRHALDLPRPTDQSADETELGNSLDRLGLGLGILYGDDAHLDAATPLYDALYACLQREGLGDIELPAGQAERIASIRERLGVAPAT
jgi:hypothetical protein